MRRERSSARCPSPSSGTRTSPYSGLSARSSSIRYRLAAAASAPFTGCHRCGTI
ncbi:MAG: hypothetical protein Q4Q62_03170 [Thermoplasmata archaeon]|nr:hypothetical protein [Thermoplasmata archaeon]